MTKTFHAMAKAGVRAGAATPPVGRLMRLIEVLPPDLRHELESIWQRHEVKAGEVLLPEEAEASHIGYVVDGLLGMVKELPDGRQHIIGLLAPTDMYGRAFDGSLGYRIEALSDSVVQTCARDDFEDILNRSSEAEHLFLVNVQDDLDAAREWVLVLSGPRVVQRVASFLLILSRRKRREDPAAATEDAPVNLKIAISRADLARYLGVRPESLSRAFHELERDGVLRINDPYDFDVIDLPGLIEVAGRDLVLEPDRDGHAP